MAGFDKNAFWLKILSLYNEAKENNYVLKMDEERVNELKALYMDLYIPMEEICHYDDETIMKKLMTAIVSVYKVDKDTMGNGGEMVQLVNTVNYDGKRMYIRFAKVSPVKMRRLELGKTRQQIAERMGYSVAAVRNCEVSFCDLTRQPEKLVRKLAKALECEPETLMQ